MTCPATIPVSSGAVHIQPALQIGGIFELTHFEDCRIGDRIDFRTARHAVIVELYCGTTHEL